jgi:hypothetical protein
LRITIKMCCIFRNFSNGANYARDLLPVDRIYTIN